MRRTFFVMLVLMLISKVTGFGRELAIAAKYGATHMSDIYVAALTLPGVIVTLFNTGLNTTLIPVLSFAEKANRKDRFFETFIAVILVLSTLVVLSLVIFAKPLCYALFHDYPVWKIDQIVFYTRWLALIALFQTITYTFIGWLQQNSRFYLATSVAIPMNILIMLAASISSPESIQLVIIASVIGYLLQAVWVTVPYLMEKKQELRLGFDLKDPYLKMFWVMVIPIFITLAASQINVLVDRTLAQKLGEGILSNMNYADKVNGLFHSVFVISLSTLLFTEQSKLSTEENLKEIYIITRKNVSIVLLISLPVMFGMMFLNQEIMRLLFMRRNYTLEMSVVGGYILLAYAGTLLGRAVFEIFAKMFFAMKMSRRPMISTIVTISLNVIFNLILVVFMGVYGLALASSIASLIGMAVIAIQAKSFFDTEKIPLIPDSAIKYLIGSGVMLAVLFLIKFITPLGRLPDLSLVLISVIMGAVGYFGTLYVLQTEELYEVVELLKNKLKRNNKG